MLDFRTSGSESKRSLKCWAACVGRRWMMMGKTARHICLVVSCGCLNTSVWFDHSTTFLTLEMAKGTCHRDLSQGSVCQVPKRSRATWPHWASSGSWITTHRLWACTAGPGLCQQCELGRLCWHGSLAFTPGCLHTSCPGLIYVKAKGCLAVLIPSCGRPAGAALGSAYPNTDTTSLLA